MYLTIVPEIKDNASTIIYHYGIHKDHDSVHYIKFGSTCELRTINKEFNLDLKDTDIKQYGGIIKLK
jgi:hypothetical protein